LKTQKIHIHCYRRVDRWNFCIQITDWFIVGVRVGVVVVVVEGRGWFCNLGNTSLNYMDNMIGCSIYKLKIFLGTLPVIFFFGRSFVHKMTAGWFMINGWL